MFETPAMGHQLGTISTIDILTNRTTKDERQRDRGKVEMRTGINGIRKMNPAARPGIARTFFQVLQKAQRDAKKKKQK